MAQLQCCNDLATLQSSVVSVIMNCVLCLWSLGLRPDGVLPRPRCFPTLPLISGWSMEHGQSKTRGSAVGQFRSSSERSELYPSFYSVPSTMLKPSKLDYLYKYRYVTQKLLPVVQGFSFQPIFDSSLHNSYHQLGTDYHY